MTFPLLFQMLYHFQSFKGKVHALFSAGSQLISVLLGFEVFVRYCKPFCDSSFQPLRSAQLL